MALFRKRNHNRENRDYYGSPSYNPFERPSVPLASVGLDNVFGQVNSDAGENVTVDKALALPAVFRCVGLLSTVVAGCPLDVFKNPGKKPIRVTALDPENVNTTYTQFELFELIVTHLALWGNAYVLKIRNQADQIIDLVPLSPALVKPKIDQDKNKIFEVDRVDEAGNRLPGNPIIYTTWEIMHVPGLGYDGLKGLSPVSMAAQTIGTALAADKLAARFYSRGTQLSGIIQVKAPLTDQTQADEIRHRWLQKSGGVGHAGEVAVLDAETTFQPLTIPPEDLQFLQSRQWQESEVALMYGIPPHLVGDTAKSTSWGAGIEQQNIGFVAYTVAGWTRRIEQRVTREVVNTRGQKAVFDLSDLMRGSTVERFQAYALAIQWGWMVRNEARARENLEPLSGLDEPLTPLNMVAGTQMPGMGTLPTVPDGQSPQGDISEEDQ